MQRGPSLMAAVSEPVPGRPALLCVVHALVDEHQTRLHFKLSLLSAQVIASLYEQQRYLVLLPVCVTPFLNVGSAVSE